MLRYHNINLVRNFSKTLVNDEALETDTWILSKFREKDPFSRFTRVLTIDPTNYLEIHVNNTNCLSRIIPKNHLNRGTNFEDIFNPLHHSPLHIINKGGSSNSINGKLNEKHLFFTVTITQLQL